jgi:hypothetical protein
MSKKKKSKRSRSAYLNISNHNDSPFDISADIEGTTRLDRLVLLDQVSGVEWEISIHNGKILVEPYDLDDKRDFRLSKVIK